MPELFHHQSTFFGCLTVERVKRVAANDPEHGAGFEALASRLWHRVRGALPDTDDVLLATRAFDTGTSARCPALDAQQRCSVHDHHKPAICRVVPFDALLPDSLQGAVLANRASEARYLGSDCIAPGPRPGLPVVTRRLQVVDEGAREALAQRREHLAQEREHWGNGVFRRLESELFGSPAALERVPPHGFMTLSLAPVLIAMVQQAPDSRTRCIAYLEAQAELAARLLGDATSSERAPTPPLRQLVAFTRSNAQLCRQLKER